MYKNQWNEVIEVGSRVTAQYHDVVVSGTVRHIDVPASGPFQVHIDTDKPFELFKTVRNSCLAYSDTVRLVEVQ